MNSVNSVALKCAKALADGNGKLATSLWDEAEKVIDGVTSGVNVYNILQWNGDTLRTSSHHGSSNLLLHNVVYSFCTYYETFYRIWFVLVFIFMLCHFKLRLYLFCVFKAVI